LSLFDTPLGENLETALSDRRDDAISNAVADVLQALWLRQLDQGQIEEAITALEDRVEFTHALSVGDAAIATGLATVEIRRRYCQALIETGALHAAEQELMRLADETDIAAKERGEALGLLGRLQKQRYVHSGEPSHLRAAIETYLTAYEEGTDPAWHGVNLMGLLHRSSEDDQETPSDTPSVSDLAEELLTTVREKPASQQFVWDMATEVESLLALDRIPEARAAAERLASSKRVKAFHLGSLSRQLNEVWRLDDTHPVLLAVREQILQHGHEAALDLPDSPKQLEKIFGAALPIGYNTLLKGLSCAESVCKITDVNGEGWGTGFLITGDAVHESLGEEIFVMTNAHVVSFAPGVGALQPAEAEARFDVLKGKGEDALRLSSMTEVWSSPPDRCDVTLLRFQGEIPKLREPITQAPALPIANEGAFVYVVGHPAGAGLKFSIRGNDLLAYEQGGSKVHYTAPTEPGSSGSPVFTPQWQLMAVHHAGSSKMRRLDDSTKTYEANEGITIHGIQQEYSKTAG
jgi:hypothetical protein